MAEDLPLLGIPFTAKEALAVKGNVFIYLLIMKILGSDIPYFACYTYFRIRNVVF